MKHLSFLTTLAFVGSLFFVSCNLDTFDSVTYNDTIVDAHTETLEAIEAFLEAEDPADLKATHKTALETVEANIATVTGLGDVEKGFKQEGLDILNFYKSELETKGAKLTELYGEELDSEQAQEFDKVLEAIFEDEDKYMDALSKAQEEFSDHHDMMLIE